MSLWALGERAHLPLVAVLLIMGVGLAAASRDLMKRLLGACVAMLGAATQFVVVTGAPADIGGAMLAFAVLTLAAGALGLVVLVRIREGFGSVDARKVRAGIEDDAARAALDV